MSTSAQKMFNGHAFGSQSKRFNLNGVHPNLLVTGRMPYESNIRSQTEAKIGPGSYELTKYSQFSDQNLIRQSETGSIWERALLTEKMAKIPHLLYQEAHKKKQEEKRMLGPGYYNIKDSKEVEAFNTTCRRGMLDTLSDRFTDHVLNNNPGPGSYGVPDEKLELKSKNKPGKVQLLDRSKQSRQLPSVGCEVPPGTYDHKSSIDELINKKVSSRGPYDVFSETRSTIKWGHYAQTNSNKLGPGQYKIESFVENIKSHENLKKGKFGKLAQYPVASGDRNSINNVGLRPRNPSWPGPGTYTPKEVSVQIAANQPPFLISANRSDKRSQAFFNNNFNSIGVGRYDIEKFDDYIDRQKVGMNSSFNSKSSRIANPNMEKVLKERLAPRNLNDREKFNLHSTGNINGSLLASV